jgi:hypothetical protein
MTCCSGLDSPSYLYPTVSTKVKTRNAAVLADPVSHVRITRSEYIRAEWPAGRSVLMPWVGYAPLVNKPEIL